MGYMCILCKLYGVFESMFSCKYELNLSSLHNLEQNIKRESERCGRWEMRNDCIEALSGTI